MGCQPTPLVATGRTGLTVLGSLGRAFFSSSPALGTLGAQERANAHGRPGVTLVLTAGDLGARFKGEMTTQEDIPTLAKAIISEEVEKEGCRLVRLILFGSRARGDARPDSDWDFYAVIDSELSIPRRHRLTTRIRRRFVRAGFYADVFIQSQEVVRQREGDTGYLTYYALKEGVEL